MPYYQITTYFLSLKYITTTFNIPKYVLKKMNESQALIVKEFLFLKKLVF